MFRGQLQKRAKKRGPVEDSGYARPSSPLLGFCSPMHGRRQMMHAKSCDLTPLRMKIQMQQEADDESNSSDESWNVAAVELNKENSCQVRFDAI